MPHTILTISLTQQIVENNRLKKLLEKAYLSDNFGCFNRFGGEIKGNEYLLKERRKVASGELVMMCCDIAGMGNLNSLVGELVVNEAVRSSLETIRRWRGVHFISQLNSGDEFIFLIDKGDIEIINRIDLIFKAHGFGGVYAVIADIDCGKDYICNANVIMEKVYETKKRKQKL
jgi:hypothetical protein